MIKWIARVRLGAVVVGAGALCVACVKSEYLGNSAEGFWSDNPQRIAPNDAFHKAQPYLEATWKARCEQVRDHDEYCEEPPIDHMVLKNGTYYLTRTSYPYEDHDEFTKYAVRVNAETGEVTPLKE